MRRRFDANIGHGQMSDTMAAVYSNGVISLIGHEGEVSHCYIEPAHEAGAMPGAMAGSSWRLTWKAPGREPVQLAMGSMRDMGLLCEDIYRQIGSGQKSGKKPGRILLVSLGALLGAAAFAAIISIPVPPQFQPAQTSSHPQLPGLGMDPRLLPQMPMMPPQEIPPGVPPGVPPPGVPLGTPDGTMENAGPTLRTTPPVGAGSFRHGTPLPEADRIPHRGEASHPEHPVTLDAKPSAPASAPVSTPASAPVSTPATHESTEGAHPRQDGTRPVAPADGTEKRSEATPQASPAPASTSDNKRTLEALKTINYDLRNGITIDPSTLDMLPHELASKIMAVIEARNKMTKNAGGDSSPSETLPRSIVARSKAQDPYGIPNIPDRMSWAAIGHPTIPLPGGGDIRTSDDMKFFGFKP